MKKLLLFVAFCSLLSAGIYAQCPGGTIPLATQAQVDAFPINYPGCTELPGDLIIGGLGLPIVDLTPLSALQSVGGDLFIINNNSLTSLTGLENLNSIGGNLAINFNNSLASLTGLENLNSIGGVLTIRSNSSLTSLTGLENLNSIGGGLNIFTNSSLTSPTGLENLNSIGGNLIIFKNSSLTSLTGLENLNSIGGNLEINFNNSLASLTGLENLNSIGGLLTIRSNSSLTSLTGLENLNSIGGRLAIESNSSLTSLTGLENLNSIGGFLSIQSNSSLTSLTGLENLNSIGGSLTIRSNSSLTNCSIDVVCDKLEDPNSFISIFFNAPGCNSSAEVEDNCGPALEALCQNTSVSLQPGGTATIMASDVDGGSSGFTNISVSPSTFNCDNLGANVVTLTVDDGNGNSDDCPATVTVLDDQGLPNSWDANNIGTAPSGNTFNFDACNGSTVSDQFVIGGGGNNAINLMSDNIAFASQTLCGDGSITAKIENADASGYGGLMIRETTAAGSKQVAVFSNMTSILRHESRTMTNMPKTIQSFFKPSPTWLRMRRQGDWVHVEYSNNGMMYLPVQSTFVMMSSCIEIGLASFIFLPMGQTSATFSNVATTGTIQDLSGDAPTTFAVDPTTPHHNITTSPHHLALFPNPATHHFTLQLETPLQEEAIVEVINLYGQSVAQQRLGAGQIVQQWNTVDWSAGTYLLRLHQAGKAPLIKQFIVMK